MSQTYSQIYLQIVFAVEWRQCLIEARHKEEIHKFITDMSLSDLVRAIKANSSRFINEKGWLHGRFRWQEGFGAFSYSHSQLDSVIRYIRNQETHHATRSFKSEYLDILRRFDVSFDPRYVFEFPNE